VRRLEKPRRLLPAALDGARLGGWWADLGCGGGVFTGVLALEAPEPRGIVAVDRDLAALRKLRVNFDRAGLGGSSLRLLRADLRCLPLEGQFEGMLAANALHFLRPAEQLALLEKCKDLLWPGGRLIVVEYNTSHGTGAVPHPLPAERFLEMAVRAGFERAHIAARTPSSYLGEMFVGVARGRNV
jgi:SAM-dependent methyltransferase